MTLTFFLADSLHGLSGSSILHRRHLSESSPHDHTLPAQSLVQPPPTAPEQSRLLIDPYLVSSSNHRRGEQSLNYARTIFSDERRGTQSLTNSPAFSSAYGYRELQSHAMHCTAFSADLHPPPYNTPHDISIPLAPFSPSHPFCYCHDIPTAPPLPGVHTESNVPDTEAPLSKSCLRDIWLQCFDEVIYNDLPQYLIHTEDLQLYPRSKLRNVFLHQARKKPLSLEDARRKQRAWGDQGLTDYYKIEIKQLVKYAIFSHRWGSSEPTFRDMMREPRHRGAVLADSGYEKLRRFCEKAKRDYGCDYVWLDTCCINKESSAELEEAIRSMYRWYHDAYICIVYLAQSSSIDDFPNEPWFNRVWTLQELLSPRRIRIYGKNWTPICPKEQEGKEQGFPLPNDKRSQRIAEAISNRTGIDIESVRDFSTTSRHRSLSEKMTWASERHATRVEDTAYSLLGIFDVTMPIAYGEGENAFTRLLDTIAQRSQDPTFFAWSGHPSHESSALPLSPSSYRMRVPFNRDAVGNGEYNIGKLGVNVKLLVLPVSFFKQADGSYILQPRDTTLANDVMITYRLPHYISDREFMYAVGIVNFRSSKNIGFIEAGARYFCIFMRDVSKYTYNINLGESTDVFVREQGAATKLPMLLSSRTFELPLTDVCLLHRYT